MSSSSSSPSPSPSPLLTSQLVYNGEQDLLKRYLVEANWALNTAVFLDPKLSPHLWQRGLVLYYSSRYSDGMAQFERDMDVNGGDVEEVLWHFICKASLMGFEKAQRDGFLPLRNDNTDKTTPPLPMVAVLALYQGHGSVEEVIKVSTPTKPNQIIPSYNRVNALGYAHFYIGIYYQLKDEMSNAIFHLKAALLVGNDDYMGQLMKVHLELIHETLLRTSCRSVIYGGWQLSSGHSISTSIDKHHIVTKLLQAIDEGVTIFDCGDIYTGVEELYGLMIEGHLTRGGKREDIQINTKLAPDLEVIKRGGVNEDYIRDVIRRSLNRLRTSYIDLVQFHWWVWSVPGYLEVFKVLKGLQKEGMVRKIGLTNCDLKHVKELNEEIKGETRIASIQIQLSLLDHRPIDSGLVSYCNEHSISILAYGVLAGGFLTDQWRGKPEPASSSQFSNRSLIKYWLIIKEFGSWELFQELLSVLHSIAVSHSPLTVQLYGDTDTCVERVTVAMVAIAYVLRITRLSGGVILGSLNINHLKDSLVASQLVLTEQDLQDIQAVVRKRCGPKGVVYGLEREQDGSHGSIMRYNLNRLNEPEHIEEVCKRFIELYLSAYPVEGTRIGYRYHSIETTPTELRPSSHDLTLNETCMKFATQVLSYDHKLNIANQEQISTYLERVKGLLTETEHISNDNLTIDQIVDRKLIISQLNLELVKWLEVRFHERDPAYYLPFDSLNYLLPSWGPEGQGETNSNTVHPGVSTLSIDYRLTCLLSRLCQIPLVLQTGIRNLIQPVTLLTERAISLCDSLQVFLKTDLPKLVHKMIRASTTQYTSLIKEITNASLIASEAVVRYKVLLKEFVLPKSSNEYLSVGASVYDKLLKFGHFVNDSSTLLKLGEDHFSLVKKQLVELAHHIDPHKSWYEITRDIIRPLHPTAQDLLSSYLSEIQRAKTHMIQHELIPSLLVPQGEQVLGFYTPQFLVPFSPFGDFLDPSPFANPSPNTTAANIVTAPDINNSRTTRANCNTEANSLTGYLMLHSVAAKSLSPDEEDKLLQSHDYTWISVIAPHECYPGHHIQALLAQNHSRILRKFYESPYFYEGWGLYCEQLAYETGFFSKDVSTIISHQQAPTGLVSERYVEYEQLSRLTQLRLQLWRAARVILDSKLHRNEMSYEECREFLIREVMFDTRSVDGEVFMYVSRPTYAPCYVAGYREILKLRENEKEKCLKEKKEFSLKTFHEKLLQTGCLPFPLIEMILNDTTDL